MSQQAPKVETQIATYPHLMLGLMIYLKKISIP
ncbi:hypothetical protein EDC91_11634 [Shewanella fodinae]|uniref:Uncharacterized protein n=1 Tax=Shewanella fodinae TaxID=552357 RepID=A0A4R2F7N2_9GAMM|nr:hypothetical protein EDC91_11634 [Shewanella fodinae]